MEVDILVYNPLQVNTYLLIYSPEECLVIDPSFSGRQEAAAFDAYVAQKGLKLTGQLNTHCHVDHIPGVPHLKEKYQLAMRAHMAELPNLQQAPLLAELYGLSSYEAATIDQAIEAGTSIPLGEEEIQVLHIPGHSAGSLAFYNERSGFVITGDALFRESIGRTDLPGGDFDTLIASIRSKLLSLPPETIVYPGHGPSSSIGHEKANNPFLNLSE